MKTVVDELTSEHGRGNTLFINAGNNFSKTLEWDEKAILDKGKARMMFKAFELMGLEVAGPGEKDFILGTAFLKDGYLQKTSQWVCANLVKMSDSSSFFAPYLLLEKGGRKVLVTGILDPVLDLSGHGLKVTDPIQALRRIQKEVAHDVFITILQTPVSGAEKWIKEVQGIDLAILGDQSGIMYGKTMVNQTLLVYNNQKGQMISHVDIRFQDDAESFEVGAPKILVLKMDEVLEDETVKEMIRDYDVWAFKQKRKMEERLANGRKAGR